MPRIARPVFAGIPHHVTQRGNRRQEVFFCDADRAFYLRRLKHYCDLNRVEVLAYCLMPNHMHAVLVPAADDAFERVFRPLHTHYAQRLNRIRGWSGHVWQGRYFSAPLDDAYLWAAVRYVERNPVRAGMVGRAESYRWSSAAAHCGLRPDRVLGRDASWLADLNVSGTWSAWLAGEDRPAELEALRENVHRGLPCGSPEFVARLESVSGQSLSARPRGRQQGWRKAK